MNKAKQIIFGLLFLYTTGLLAQVDTSMVQSAEFDGELKIRLRDAGKISSNPAIIEQKSKMEKIKFNFLPTPSVTTQDPEKLSAAKINVIDKLPNLQNGYVIAGMGNYITPVVDAHYSSGRNKKGDFGTRIYHLSSQGGVVPDSNLVKSNYSETKGQLYGRYFFDHFSIKGSANYLRNLNQYYGAAFDGLTDSLVRISGDRQLWQSMGGAVELDKFSRDSTELNYNGAVRFNHGFGRYGEKEEVLDSKLGLSKMVRTEIFAVDLGFQWNSFTGNGALYNEQAIALSATDSLVQSRKQENMIIRFQPSAYTVWKDLRVKVGMGVFIEPNAEKPANFYPELELKWNIMDGLLLPYAGVKGGVELNTFHNIMEQNAFIISNPLLKNRNNKLEAYAGINGVVSSKMGYELGANWNRFENQMFFANDFNTAYGNRFNVLYGNMDRIDAHARWMMRSGEHWEWDLLAHYYYYDVQGSNKAWNMPNWKGTATGRFKFNDQWNIAAQVHYIGDRYALMIQDTLGAELSTINELQWNGRSINEQKMRGFVDANLEVKYQYNQQIAAWARVYNTVAQRYQIWNGYDQQRTLFQLGAALSF